MTIEQFLDIKLGEQVEKQFGFFSEDIRQDILDRMLQKENKKSIATFGQRYNFWQCLENKLIMRHIIIWRDFGI